MIRTRLVAGSAALALLALGAVASPSVAAPAEPPATGAAAAAPKAGEPRGTKKGSKPVAARDVLPTPQAVPAHRPAEARTAPGDRAADGSNGAVGVMC